MGRKSNIEKKLGEELFDALDYYANSAVVLYGVVTFDELDELIARYRPDCRVEREDLIAALKQNMKYEDCSFFLFDEYVCHVEFDCGKDTLDAIDAFLDERAGKPRWYPADEHELFNYCEDSVYLESKTARTFGAFLETHGLPEVDPRYDLLFDIVYMHQAGTRPAKLIGEVSKKCELATKTDGMQFANLLMQFLNNMRLRSNNGWTPDEAIKTFSKPVVNEQPKVGRNDLCPCGSGKKYKKCCGK